MGPTLAAILHRLATFWPLRKHDLLADLSGQLQGLSDALQIPMTEARLQQFAATATFDRMRKRADDLVPDAGNRICHSNRDFFPPRPKRSVDRPAERRGPRRYHERVADLLPADLATWARSGWPGADTIALGVPPSVVTFA